MMNEREMMKEEFIGLKAQVDRCTDPSLQGIEGMIIDETKNMLVIESGKSKKKIAKDIAAFSINGTVIDGKKMKYRPEDRIRKIK